MTAHEDHDHADHADDERAEGRDGRDASDRTGDVFEQPFDPLAEGALFSIFGAVGFDDTDAVEGLAQPPRHVGVDLLPFAEDGAEPPERIRHHRAEGGQDQQRDHRHLPVEIDQIAEGERRRKDTADEQHDAGADEVADAVGVGHNTRDQHAALGVVEEADRQADDVVMHPFAHLHDGPLRRHADHLRQRKRRDGLHQRRRADGQRQQQQQIEPVVGQDVVDEPLETRRQDEAAEPANDHQHEAEGELLPVRPHQPPRLRPRRGQRQGLFLFLLFHNTNRSWGQGESRLPVPSLTDPMCSAYFVLRRSAFRLFQEINYRAIVKRKGAPGTVSAKHPYVLRFTFYAEAAPSFSESPYRDDYFS